MSELAQAVLSGSRRALARTLTQVENETPASRDLLAALYPHTGRAWVIGVTGAPGTGKSSLVNALAAAYRRENKTVGIVAVDPTSPFTGGAILGDRIRMRDLSGDPGVFIRSMATRGSLGGLARATRDVVRVLDAAGFDIIMVETVGAGQSEVDIVRMAHTTVVVEAPGMGDDVQAIKAGILEIADILVVNKADRPGADNTVRTLRAMLELGHPTRRVVNHTFGHHGRLTEVTPHPPTPSPSGRGEQDTEEVVRTPYMASSADRDAKQSTPHAAKSPSPFEGEGDLGGEGSAPIWLPPVIRTIASHEVKTTGDGIAELADQIARHRAHLIDAGQLAVQERERIQLELYERLRQALFADLMRAVPEAKFAEITDAVQRRDIDPHSAVQAILSSRETTNQHPPTPSLQHGERE